MKLNKVLAGLSALSIAASMVSVIPASAVVQGYEPKIVEITGLNDAYDFRDLHTKAIEVRTSLDGSGYAHTEIVASQDFEIMTDRLYLGSVMYPDIMDAVIVSYGEGKECSKDLVQSVSKPLEGYTEERYELYYYPIEHKIKAGEELLVLDYVLDESAYSCATDTLTTGGIELFGYNYTYEYYADSYDNELYFTDLYATTQSIDTWTPAGKYRQDNLSSDVREYYGFLSNVVADNETSFNNAVEFGMEYMSDNSLVITATTKKNLSAEAILDFGGIWFDDSQVDVVVTRGIETLKEYDPVNNDDVFNSKFNLKKEVNGGYQSGTKTFKITLTPKSTVTNYAYCIAGAGFLINDGIIVNPDYDRAGAKPLLIEDDTPTKIAMLTEKGDIANGSTYYDNVVTYTIEVYSDDWIVVTGSIDKSLEVDPAFDVDLGSFAYDMSSLESELISQSPALLSPDDTDTLNAEFIPYYNLTKRPTVSSRMHYVAENGIVPAGNIFMIRFKPTTTGNIPFVLAGYDNFIEANVSGRYTVKNAGNTNEWASPLYEFNKNNHQVAGDGSEVVFSNDTFGLAVQNGLAYGNGINYDYKLNSDGSIDVVAKVVNKIELETNDVVDFGILAYNNNFGIEWLNGRDKLTVATEPVNGRYTEKTDVGFINSALSIKYDPAGSVINPTDNLFAFRIYPKNGISQIINSNLIFDFFGIYMSSKVTPVEDGYSYYTRYVEYLDAKDWTTPVYTAFAEKQPTPEEPTEPPTEEPTTEPTEEPTTEEPTTEPLSVTKVGDVNLDGETDILDVIYINKTIFGKAQMTAQGVVNSDANNDHRPDATDSLQIMKLIVELITEDEFFFSE